MNVSRSRIIILMFIMSVGCWAQTNDTIPAGTVNSFPYTGYEAGLCKRNFKAFLPDSNRNASDAVIEYKIQQILALKLGLVKDISYKSFKQAFVDENRGRARMKAENKLFYGPLQFSEDSYFSYYVTNLILALKQEYAKTKYVLDEKRLHTLYNDKKESLYKIPDAVLYLRVELKSTSTDTACSLSAVRLMENILRKDNRISIDNPHPDKLKVTVDYLNFNADVLSESEKENYYGFQEITAKTQKGEFVTRQITPGHNEIYKILDRIHKGYRSFETVKNALILMDIDSQYAQYIKALKESSIIVQF